jgi:gas vesicle protein
LAFTHDSGGFSIIRETLCLSGQSIHRYEKTFGGDCMTNQENKCLRTMGVFVYGGLIGAAAALLFAPRSGKETRQSLARMGKKAKNELNVYREELSEKMEGIFNDFQADLKSCMDDGKDWTEDKISEIQHTLQKNRRKIEVELDRILNSRIS